MNRDLAGALRTFIATCPDLPVPQSDFFIDALSANMCLSLQMLDGDVLQQDIDGYKQIAQPFVLLYKDKFNDSPAKRSQMMATLNKMGAWLEKKSEDKQLPKLTNMAWESIEQMGYSSILSQDAGYITYRAQYSLIFNFTE